VANDTRFALSAGVVTTSLKFAAHFRRHLQAGMVMVNAPTAGVDAHVPLGGRKESGCGLRGAGRAAAEFYATVETAYGQAQQGVRPHGSADGADSHLVRTFGYARAGDHAGAAPRFDQLDLGEGEHLEHALPKAEIAHFLVAELEDEADDLIWLRRFFAQHVHQSRVLSFQAGRQIVPAVLAQKPCVH